MQTALCDLTKRSPLLFLQLTAHDSTIPHEESLCRQNHFLLIKRGHLRSLKHVAEFKKESQLTVFINVSVPEHALLLWYVHDGGLISRGLKSTVD
jgi:hypothetical protein